MNATTYAVDTAKNVMQLHWVDVDTGEIHRKKLARTKFIEFFASLRAVRVVMEACAGSHHWARTLKQLGHEVELLPAHQVRAFVVGNKDDAADARGIWHAATRGDIRRVPIKSIDQQAVLSLHRTRAHWVGIRTATINSMRGLLYEFGVFLPQGRRIALNAIGKRRADIDEKLPAPMVRLVDEQLRTLREIDGNVKFLDREIAATQKTSRAAKVLNKVPGIGTLGSSALAAILGDGKAWRNGREFSASLGLCPGHTGTGGKVRMGSISKRGDPYLRTLLVCGARAVASSPNAPEWVRQMMLRRPVNIVVVALANKLARTAWALVAHARNYETDWKSLPPAMASRHAEAGNAA
jgi:transposase